MALSRQKKEEIVDKLKKTLKDAKSIVFVNFKGLSVTDATAIRHALRNEGVFYTVAKKTLTNRVLDSEKFDGVKPALEGELAIAWGDDIIAPARGIYTFQKKFPGNLRILGGVIEKRYMSAAEMTEIATIPGIDILRAKFVNIINSPIQRLAFVLSEISKLKSN